MSEDISPWFQRGHFERPLVRHIFSTLPVKYKASKTSPKCYVTKSLTQRFNVNVTTWYQGTRVEPGQLVVFDSALTCQENGNTFHSFIARAIYKYTILKVSERVRTSLEQPEAEVQ